MRILKNDSLSFEIAGGIGIITLDAPQGNRMTMKFLQDFNTLFIDTVYKHPLKGMIIRSEGRHFSCGADVEELSNNTISKAKIDDHGIFEAFPNWFTSTKEVFIRLQSLKVPVVVAAKGLCLGSGLEFAMSGNVRICSNECLMGYPESTFGILPGVTGTLQATRELGRSNALYLVLSGKIVNAQEAVHMGLFHKVVDKKDLDAYAVQVVRRAVQDADFSKDDVMHYFT